MAHVEYANSANEDSRLLGCYNMVTGKQLPTFQSRLFPLPSGSKKNINCLEAL
jgi:hypothetical protein